MSVRKAVIPVAGFATRFLPACKSLPKCMLTILDKPIIQYLVDEAVASGDVYKRQVHIYLQHLFLIY